MDRPRTPIEQRFWPKVLRAGADDCWIWTGHCDNKNGYGWIGAGGHYGKAVHVHRLAYELAFGAIPEGLCVLHHCDNPACVNPSHLFLGTQKDNIEDMIRKGRRFTGNGNAKLTLDQVREIRRLYGTGQYSQRQLGRQFGVTYPNIGSIVRGESWKVSRPW
jgi:hypothetical protein